MFLFQNMKWKIYKNKINLKKNRLKWFTVKNRGKKMIYFKLCCIMTSNK